MTESIKVGAHGVWWGPEEGFLWASDGRVGLPPAVTEADAITHVARYEAGEFYCAGCQEWFQKPASFQRFAGLYCEPCGEQYKAANSRRCGICGRPIWDCYC